MDGRYLSVGLIEFCEAYPELADVAIARDAAGRKGLGPHSYALYDQDTYKPIFDRAHAPAAGVAAIGTPVGDGKSLCSICKKNVFDFKRHNQERHIRDPDFIFYCPYLDCDTSIARDGDGTRDDHLACTHNDFRNTGGRGGELLWRSDKRTVLSKLSRPAARFVAQYRQTEAQNYENRRVRLVQRLINADIHYPDLEGATLPSKFSGGVDCMAFTKADAIDHAIDVRHMINHWDAMFATAQGLLLSQTMGP